MTGSPTDEQVAGLASPDSDARALALGELVDLGSDGTAPLLEALTADRAEVRRLAAEGLGLIGDPEAADALAAAVRDPDEMVRAHAATALARLGDPRAVDALVETLDDAHDLLHADLTLSSYSLMSLGAAAVPGLVGVLGSGSEPERAMAAFVLRKIASDRFDEADGDPWRELDAILEGYRPDGPAKARARSVAAIQNWVESDLPEESAT